MSATRPDGINPDAVRGVRPPIGPAPHAGRHNAITDVAGIRVGHHQRIGDGWLTGSTVVLAPPGTTASGDVRGGGPATTETALLDPVATVQHANAIVLSGGSAYGLAVADGVRAWLAERNEGFRIGPEPHHVVPIVPAACLFDLGAGGRFGNRPDAEFGVAAAAAATDGPVAMGTVGAGTGAHARHLKGGLGTASVVLANGVTVGALVALNSAGSTIDPRTGLLWGAYRGLPGEFATAGMPTPDEVAAYVFAESPLPSLNTTLAVIATDAELTKAECARLAIAGHDGMARAIDPVHTPIDGDVVFTLATGATPLAESGAARILPIAALMAAAADTVARAIAHAMLAATSAGELVSYRDTFPSAFA